MRKLGQQGAIDVWLILFVMAIVLFLSSLGFGIWAYSSRQDYKNNVDEKIDAAVEIAVQEAKSEKDNEFIQREKKPLKEYSAPAAAGSIKVKYPKTWSAYIDQRTQSGESLNAYFNPNFVPGEDTDATYALRIVVDNKSFDDVVEEYDSEIESGKIKAKPYKLPKVKNAVGLQLDGEIDTKQQGTMILLQLRDKTIKVWTEGDQYRADLFDDVLQNLSFSP